MNKIIEDSDCVETRFVFIKLLVLSIWLVFPWYPIQSKRNFLNQFLVFTQSGFGLTRYSFSEVFNPLNIQG